MSNEKDYTAKLIQIARRYYGNNTLIDWEDVKQTADLITTKARRVYDAARACKFTTFSYPYIKTAIRRNIEKQLKDKDHYDDTAIQIMPAKDEELDSKIDNKRLIILLDKTIDSLQALPENKKILKLLIRGYAPADISNTLGVSKNKVYGTLATNKHKLQEVYNLYYGGVLDV